jgi:hypothetical protein
MRVFCDWMGHAWPPFFRGRFSINCSIGLSVVLNDVHFPRSCSSIFVIELVGCDLLYIAEPYY